MKARNIFKRSAAAAIIFLMAAASVNVSAGAPAFPDVAGHWAQSYIAALTDKGLINGMPDGLFHPDGPVTLEQFLKIIVADKLGEKQPVNGGNWASGYVEAALENNIIDDVDLAGGFTRGTAAKVVELSLENLFGENRLDDTSVAEQLVDYPSCHSCQNYISDVYAKGIMVGRPGPVFDSGAALTRAEASVIIMKMLDPALRTPPGRPAGDAASKTSLDGLMSAGDLKTIMDSDESAVVVDVRTQEEYDAGHIPGGISIPLDELKAQCAELLPNKTAVIVVYCQSGVRSSQAYEFLIGQGYKNVHDFGGVSRWPYALDKNR